MARGRTAQLGQMFVFDLESCDGDQIYTVVDGVPVYDQRVWLCGFMNLESGIIRRFTDLDQCMGEIFTRGDENNQEYAVHNLKFDGSFILPWLFDHGYQVTQSKPSRGEFSVLIDEMNNWYNITVQVTQRKRVVFWDSLKLFPVKLEYLHEVYNTPTKKIQEDQSFYEEVRSKDHIPTDVEVQYFNNDLIVLCETLLAHIREYGLRFKKTQASQAFYNFEQEFKTWRWRFPPMEVEEDQMIRSAYWGGISYVPPHARGLDIREDIGVYDINSSYPHKMGFKRLPYGPVRDEYGPGKHPNMSKFWIACAYVKFDLKEYHVPCIPKKAITEGVPVTMEKWLHHSDGVVRLSFSCIDYEMMLQSYDLEVVSWVWVKHWSWKIHKELQRFVSENNTLKVEYKKMAKTEKDPDKRHTYLAKSQRAKIDNNASYGKWGEGIIKIGKTPYSDPDEGVVFRVDREDITKEYSRKYLPIAIAITAYGRQQLLTVANALGRFNLYQDTDSIHYLKEGGQQIIDDLIRRGVMVVHDTDLGAWKHEGNYIRGKYLRPKCYLEIKADGTQEVTLAGLPADKHTGQHSKQRSCIVPESFRIGAVIPGGNGKLRTIRTRTGNKLLPVDFTITEHTTFLR